MSILPKELLAFIFKDFSKSELFECMKVCRWWYSSASILSLQEITVKDNNHREFLELCQKPRLDGSRIGDYVKIFSICYIVDENNSLCNLEKEEFYQLLKSLPRLRKIKTSMTYMLYLKTAPTAYLPFVQQVEMDPYHFAAHLIRDYFQVHLQLKAQITTLKLRYQDITHVMDDYRKLLEILPSFTQLKELVLDNRGTRNTKQLNLASVLNACSRDLTYLYFFQNSSEISLKSNTVHLNLRSLCLYVQELKEGHLLYFVRFLPNLKRLKINTSSEGSLEKLLTSRTIHRATATEFALYLRALDHVDIEQEGLITSLEDPDLETSAQVFWQFIQDVCGETCHCHLEANLVCEKSQYAHFKKEGHTLFVQCDLVWDVFMQTFWINQIDWIVFNKVHIVNNVYFDDEEEEFYQHVILPVLNILKRQQYKRYKLQLIDSPRKIRFQGSASMISGFTLRADLLRTLGQLYPYGKYLALKQCTIEKEKEDSNMYILDLSHFKHFSVLEIDLDVNFGRRKTKRPLYIKLVSTAIPEDTSDYYYCHLRNMNAVYHYSKKCELEIPKKFYQLKILYPELLDLYFTRSGITIPVIEYYAE